MQKFKLNKTDYKILLGYLSIATLWLLFRNYVENYTLREYLIDIPVFWMQTIVLLLFSKIIIEYIIFENKNYFFIALIAIIGFWFIGFITYISGEFSRDGYINLGTFKINFQTIIYNIQNSSVNLALPLALISGKKYYDFQLDRLIFSNSKKELELKLLHSKFSPHFLYNSLNTIDALIDYSPKDTVKKYINNLARLYRYLIDNQEEEIVNLSEEIELVKSYIFLIETRFENNYKFCFQTEEINKDKFIPNGGLLTAIENVIKHNKPTNDNLVFTNIIFKNDYIEISNNLGFSKNNKPLGTGIKNLKRRYKLLSNKKIELLKTNKTYTIRLPLLNLID